ncbi:MAG TPA: hypothetical protein VGN37_17110 [Actinocatenispora sp.]
MTAEAALLAAPTRPRLDLYRALDPPTGPPRLDPTGRSEVPGCWIVGSAALAGQHAVMAAAHGATAATAVKQNLLDEDLSARLSRALG